MKTLFVSVLSIGISLTAIAQVGVGTAAPDNSSILELNSTNKGVLIPRLTSAEIAAISSPAAGLLVFDTSKQLFYYYANSTWLALNPWNTTYGTNATMTTQTPGSFGNVGVGVSSPTEKLDVDGTVKLKGLRFNDAPDLDAQPSVKGQSNGNYISFSDGTKHGYQGFDDNTFYYRKSPGQTTDVKMDVEGEVKANNFVGYGTIPVGGIIMWSGAIGSIPTGWALCDGSTVNGVVTPNLKERFIVGAGTSDNGSVSGAFYNVGSTGGANSVTLTVNQMPTHNHDVTDPGHKHVYTKTNHWNTGDGDNANDRNFHEFNPDSNAETSQTTTGISIQNKGGGAAHENRPPFYALAFIIRTH